MTGTNQAGDGEAAPSPHRPAPPVTAWRFAGAFLLACLLFFVVLVVFAFAGLGPIGLAPAIVVAMALTSRATGIRRMSVLMALGILSFVTVVVLTYAAAIVVYLGATPAAG